MFERFTTAARTAVLEAVVEAQRLHADHVGADHLLLGVIAGGGRTAQALATRGVDRDTLARHIATLGDGDAEALRSVGVDLDEVRRQVEESFGAGALDRPRSRRRRLLRRRAPGHLPFTAAARSALEGSLREAIKLKSRSIDAEHLVLGLLAGGTAPVSRTLARLGVDPALVRERMLEELRRSA